jgi:hypothetical protein
MYRYLDLDAELHPAQHARDTHTSTAQYGAILDALE